MDWKIDRHFDYDSVNFYYANKIAAFHTENIQNLPTLAFNTIDKLGEHLRTVVRARLNCCAAYKQIIAFYWYL
jgi:hypothetical protein